ncbi:MAG: hypothetical protein JXR83_13990 [Deltaproteobacteria bacterium]|nr:hypothetical protein [Deltaproteobacteria bacterium]
MTAKSVRGVAAAAVMLAGLFSLQCDSDQIERMQGGLRVRVLNAGTAALYVRAALQHNADRYIANATVQRPETVVEIAEIAAGLYQLEVTTRDIDGAQLNLVNITDVTIRARQTTELVIDLAFAAVIELPCDPNSGEIYPLCTYCNDQGAVVAASDDERCGAISCSAFDYLQLRGDNTASGTSTCVRGDAADVTTGRCLAAGQCISADGAHCPVSETTLASADTCHFLRDCELGTPSVETFDDGTPCGVDLECQAGNCVPIDRACVPGQPDLPLCAECPVDELVPLADDDRCGAISCAAFGWWDLRGDNSPSGESQCVRGSAPDITADRCVAIGQCAVASAERCPISASAILTAGLCQTITGCSSGAPALVIADDGTPCGINRECRGGECVPTAPDVGCADGTREGFVSLTMYTGIAGCSGGWSVGGVTRADLAPTCNRAAGNSGSNVEGAGCSAADLCASGWHVCRGKGEVAAKAPGGCAEAAPAGAPDKTLFFAVQQNSTQDSVCDSSGNGNDVFGCGNLGTLLTGEKNCGPLTRVLASMAAGSCGFNEAEPPLGPWMCTGGADSHLMEGALVTKNGCPPTRVPRCEYEGNPIGNSDKGGVLCCKD